MFRRAPLAVVWALLFVTAAHAAPPAGSSRLGPIPDYAPVEVVWTHPQLERIAPALGPALDRTIGKRHRVEDYAPLAVGAAVEGEEVELDEAGLPMMEVEPPGGEDAFSEEDDSLVWMRDYQPIYVRRPGGQVVGLRYLHDNPNRQAYLPYEAPRDPFAGERAAAPGMVFEHLPLLHENGNLVVAGRYVLVTELILEDNTVGLDAPHLDAAGFVPLSPEDVVATLAKAFSRRPSEIIVLPRMPAEETGHVDLFVMALDDDTVVVPTIRDEALAVSSPVVEWGTSVDVREHLDGVAARLAGLGLRVVRLPMLPPLWLPSVDEDGSVDPVVYSPANGLLLRTEKGARVLVPSADLRDAAPAFARMQRRYEQEWVTTLARHGWTAKRVDATRLGRFLGLFRCVSQVVPQ